MPSGLPSPTIPNMAHADELLVPSGIIAVVGFALHYATASTFARKSGSQASALKHQLPLTFKHQLPLTFKRAGRRST